MKTLFQTSAACALLAFPLALAGPADYVYTPLVEHGERELDLKFGTAKTAGTPRQTQFNAGLGWGATSFWFTELYVKFKGEDLSHLKYDAVELENKFQLTETGRWPVELGLLLEIERPNDHAEGWELKSGPLLQAGHGLWQYNANLLFERSFDTATPSETELAWQLQAKARWTPALEAGVQYFGAPGALSDWEPAEKQAHRIGPAIFGKTGLGGRQALKYNAALLFGLSEASPDSTFRLQTEYEF